VIVNVVVLVVLALPAVDVLLHLVAAPAITRLARTNVGIVTETMTARADVTGIVLAALIIGMSLSSHIFVCILTQPCSDRERDSKDERDDRDRRENGTNGDERKRMSPKLDYISSLILISDAALDSPPPAHEDLDVAE
jgi:hypothetical protein